MEADKLYYKSGYKYQLTRPCVFKTKIYGYNIDTDYIMLTTYGELTLKKGYAWDGCSGPTKDDKTNMRAGALHDALYQLMRLNLIEGAWRGYADACLKELCRHDGMSKFRAWYYYEGVENFADKYATAAEEQKERVAP